MTIASSPGSRGSAIVVPETAATSRQDTVSSWTATVTRAMRPAQWLKNGVVFAGLVFGGKLLRTGCRGERDAGGAGLLSPEQRLLPDQ